MVGTDGDGSGISSTEMKMLTLHMLCIPSIELKMTSNVRGSRPASDGLSPPCMVSVHPKYPYQRDAEEDDPSGHVLPEFETP